MYLFQTIANERIECAIGQVNRLCRHSCIINSHEKWVQGPITTCSSKAGVTVEVRQRNTHYTA